MSQLGEQIDRWFTGGRPAPGFLEGVRQIIADAGSKRAAARRIGVDPAQIRRWLRGARPKPASVAKFDRIIRATRAPQISNTDIKISTQERGSRKSGGGYRTRELRARNLRINDDGAAGRIRDAYVQGGAEAAAHALRAEVHDAFYARLLGDMSVEESNAAEVESGYEFTILSVG